MWGDFPIHFFSVQTSSFSSVKIRFWLGLHWVYPSLGRTNIWAIWAFQSVNIAYIFIWEPCLIYLTNGLWFQSPGLTRVLLDLSLCAGIDFMLIASVILSIPTVIVSQTHTAHLRAYWDVRMSKAYVLPTFAIRNMYFFFAMMPSFHFDKGLDHDLKQLCVP